MGICNFVNKLLHTRYGKLYLLITCVWGQAILGFVNGLAGSFVGELGAYASTIITSIVVLFSFSSIASTVNKNDTIAYSFFLFLYFLEMFLFPENSEYLEKYAFDVFICTVPVFYVGCVCDIQKIDKLLFWTSACFIVLQFLYLFFYLPTHESNSFDTEETEHMGTAYTLLGFTLYIMWYTFRNCSILNIGLSLLGIFQILTCGVRAPLLFVFIFVIMYAVLFADISKTKRLLICLLLAVVGILVVFYSEVLLWFFMDVLDVVGMSNRIVRKFIEGDILVSDEREDIVNSLNKALSYNKALGLGIFGSWNITGLYAHNVLLDFWCSFGYPIGSLLLLLLVRLFLKAYKICNSFERQFLLILFILGFLQMFISNFFLFNAHFFMLLGYCKGRIRGYKLKQLV